MSRETNPLVARLASNSPPPMEWITSRVWLEFQVQRELDAPWNVALARHLSKASSTPVRIGGAVKVAVKSIPKQGHKTEIDVLHDFGVLIEVEILTVFGEPPDRRICP